MQEKHSGKLRRRINIEFRASCVFNQDPKVNDVLFHRTCKRLAILWLTTLHKHVYEVCRCPLNGLVPVRLLTDLGKTSII